MKLGPPPMDHSFLRSQSACHFSSRVLPSPLESGLVNEQEHIPFHRAGAYPSRIQIGPQPTHSFSLKFLGCSRVVCYHSSLQTTFPLGVKIVWWWPNCFDLFWIAGGILLHYTRWYPRGDMMDKRSHLNWRGASHWVKGSMIIRDRVRMKLTLVDQILTVGLLK